MGKSKNGKKNKKLWNRNYFIKSIIAGFTLLTAVINLIVAILNFINKKTYKAVAFSIGIVIFSLICISAFSLLNLQRNSGIKSKSDYDKFIEKTSSIIHNLLHRVRNSIYYMENAYNFKKFDSASNFEQYITQDTLQLVDFLAIELKNLLGKDIRACIKCIDYTDLNEYDVRKMKVITFARSGQRNIYEIMVEHRHPKSIQDNTEFSEIIESENNDRQRQYFYEKDLVKYEDSLRKKGKEYKNTNSMWKNDYITKIVCPIRLKITKRVLKNIDHLEYNLIGFLCIDSLDKNAFDNEYKDFCLELIKGLADILYIYFDRFIEYYNGIDDKTAKENINEK